jgi:hypothetical protein
VLAGDEAAHQAFVSLGSTITARALDGWRALAVKFAASPT